MESIIIRNIEKEDIPAVVDIQISGWQTAYKGIVDDLFLNSMNIEERIKQRNQDYNQGGFIVAELNKQIVSYCRYVNSNVLSPETPEIDCELSALYVKPNLKNNGIGTKMFQYVINEFKAQNKTKMIIWCLKDNFPSRNFYEKMGGKIIKERPITIGNKNYMEVGFLYNMSMGLDHFNS